VVALAIVNYEIERLKRLVEITEGREEVAEYCRQIENFLLIKEELQQK
jgi:hypothetical protein